MSDPSNPQQGMEKRVIIASVLCLLVFLIWQAKFMPRPAPRKPGPGGQEQVAPQGAGGQPGKGPVKPDGVNGQGVAADPGNGQKKPPVPVPQPEATRHPEERFTCRNEFFEVVFTSRGAGIEKVTLLDYYDTVENKKKQDPEHCLVLLDVPPESPPAAALSLVLDDAPDLERINWQVKAKDADAASITYQYTCLGYTLEKTLTLPSSERAVNVSVSINGQPAAGQSMMYTMAGPLGLKKEALLSSRRDAGAGHIAALESDGEVHAQKFDIMGKQTSPAPVVHNVVWGAVSNKYFTSILQAQDDEKIAPPYVTKGMIEIKPDPALFAKVQAELALKQNKAVSELSPADKQEAAKNTPSVGRPLLTAEIKGGSGRHGYRLLFAPQDASILKEYPSLNFDLVISYGYFLAPEFLVKIFLSVLKVLRVMVRDYGLAIILLTLLVKLILHPLNRKNQKAMQTYQAKMQKVQPELDKLKERYKNNRRKMHTEMQALMKEKGVNPQQMLGGCLMMFLQLPIWVALISVFRTSIELRQQPGLFSLIPDLSIPDRTIPFGSPLPLVGWEFLNILPVLYVIITLIHQRMMPKPQNEQARSQQKMMGFMMIFFGFIFYSFPSGLLLYFLTSSLLGIVEQRIIKLELKADKEREAEAEAEAQAVTQAPFKQTGNRQEPAARKKKPKNKKKRR